MKKYLGGITGLTALSSLLGSTAVMAEGERAMVLEEIIVTSQKREQNLQDVPISVSVMTGADLDAVGAFNFEDYASKVPNLSFGVKSGGGDGRSSGMNIAIRGISGRGTTAVYIDEVPLPESIGLKIIDVARVEVLRGPQGTLYGASSMGGALKIITNQPDLSEFTADARITGSSVKEGDENYRMAGTVNLPLVEDSLALRVTGFYDSQSGIYDRIVTDPASARTQDNVDDTRSLGVHVGLAWAPTDALLISPKLIYQKIESDGFPWADADINEFDQFRIHGVEEPLEDELTSLALVVKYDLDVGTVTSATSYVKRDVEETEDFTEFSVFGFGLNPPPPSPVSGALAYSKFVQELRFTSNFDGPMQFVVGAFYSKGESDRHRSTDTPGLEAYAADQFGLPLGTPIFGGSDLVFASEGSDKTEEYAIFGELSYELGEAWTALVGLRYYDTFQDLDVALDGIVNGGPSAFKGDLSEDGVNPKVNLSYQMNDDVMMYGTAAKGFRSGGFNANSEGVSNFCQSDLADLGLSRSPSTYKEDSLWSYELGSKATLFDGRVRMNGAVFFVEWDDLQQGVTLPCGFSIVSNVGTAESLGAEIEISVRPIDPLNLTLAVGYVDATITDAGGNTAAEDGDRVLEVPEWTYSASAEYSWGLSSGAEVVLRGDLRGASDSWTTFDTSDEQRRRAEFTVVDFRLSYFVSNWQAALFINNATDERVNFSDGVSTAAETPGRPRIATNRPRTIGLTARTQF